MSKDSNTDAGWDQASFWQRNAEQETAEGWASTPPTEADGGTSATHQAGADDHTHHSGAANPPGFNGPSWSTSDRSSGGEHQPGPAARRPGNGVPTRITVGLGAAVLAAAVSVILLRACTPELHSVRPPGQPGALPVASLPDQPSSDNGIGPATSPSDSPAAPQPSSSPSAKATPRPSTHPTSTAAAAAPTPPGARKVQFLSQISGKPFGVANQSTANGASVVQFPTGGGLAAQWFLVDVGSGYVAIINANSRKALDDTDGSTADGTPLQQWEFFPGAANQQWQIISLGEFSTIVNRKSGRVIDLRDGKTTNGTVIQQWTSNIASPNQHWKLIYG